MAVAAAPAFAALFVAEGFLIAWSGVLRGHLQFQFQRSLRGWCGLAIIGLAALLYPVLQEKGWRLHVVNINEDEVLTAKYGIRIPVIVTPDGREKGWPFTAGQVRRLISGP